MAAVLGANHHGKGRVRIVKVIRSGERQSLMQFNVEINLVGPQEVMTPAFTRGDNTVVIPTDTQKNTVYVVAKRNSFESAEEFALLISKHFLDTYPKLVNFVRVTVKQDIWERLQLPNSRGVVAEHNHAFKKVGPHYTYAKVEATRSGAKLWGGIRGYTLLKTAQSAFTDYNKCQYTTLPPATDRLMGSNFDAEWSYTPAAVAAASSGRGANFPALHAAVLDAMTKEFAGPSDTGVFSASVQKTLFDMGAAAIAAAPQLQDITLYMPNVHNMPFDLAKLGLSNKDHTGNIDILYPIDEPHGIIQATICRPGARL